MQELDLVTAAAWRSEEEGVGGGDKKKQKKQTLPVFTLQHETARLKIPLPFNYLI